MAVKCYELRKAIYVEDINIQNGATMEYHKRHQSSDSANLSFAYVIDQFSVFDALAKAWH